MADEDRRSLLRSVTDEQYKDLMKVLAGFPQLSMTITTEVIDDETQHVVTAGSIVTVTISITRKGLDMHLGSLGLGLGDSDEEIDEKDADEIEDNIDDEEDENLDKEMEEKEEEKKKGPVWKKPQQKKKAKKPGKQSGKPKQKAKSKTEAPATPNAESKEVSDESSYTLKLHIIDS